MVLRGTQPGPEWARGSCPCPFSQQARVPELHSLRCPGAGSSDRMVNPARCRLARTAPLALLSSRLSGEKRQTKQRERMSGRAGLRSGCALGLARLDFGLTSVFALPFSLSCCAFADTTLRARRPARCDRDPRRERSLSLAHALAADHPPRSRAPEKGVGDRKPISGASSRERTCNGEGAAPEPARTASRDAAERP